MSRNKSISISDSLWLKALSKAKNNGQSLSFVIRTLLEMWLNGLSLEIEEN